MPSRPCTPDTAPLLADSTQSLPNLAGGTNVAPASSGCNSSTFWITSELIYNCANVLAQSTYSFASIITDTFQMKPDYEKIKVANKAIAISAPLSIACAVGEAYCHRAESRYISYKHEHPRYVDPEDQRLPALSVFQFIAVGLHLFNDVSTNISFYLAVGEILGLKEETETVRFGVYAGLSLYSLWGSMQETFNSARSIRQMNAIDREEARARVSIV